ncbi:hypothetical protein EVAR_23176_1 [Eumeta japonica]|uniref:Uncharacterized protein n=1 Tax=Eumeta variegata TaxID=151549 RepID=A0A4C2AD68_EUMVA|nr:hypothetical protein EVAR_23176_1 [Eumeta japonica]
MFCDGGHTRQPANLKDSNRSECASTTTSRARRAYPESPRRRVGARQVQFKSGTLPLRISSCICEYARFNTRDAYATTFFPAAHRCIAPRLQGLASTDNIIFSSGYALTPIRILALVYNNNARIFAALNCLRMMRCASPTRASSSPHSFFSLNAAGRPTEVPIAGEIPMGDSLRNRFGIEVTGYRHGTDPFNLPGFGSGRIE